MTHTLHRRGDEAGLQEDYVMLVLFAKGINEEGAEEKMSGIWDLFSKYKSDLTNFGNLVGGNSLETGIEALKKAYPARPLTEPQLASWLGLSPAQANTAFRKHVVARAKQGETDFRFQQARAEASRMGREGDWAGAVEQLSAASRLRPEDLDTLYRLALAEILRGRMADADRNFNTAVRWLAEHQAQGRRGKILGGG